MKLTIIVLAFIFFILSACVGLGPVTKADKLSRKEAKFMRKNEIQLSAICSGTMTFSRIEFRDPRLFQLYGHTAIAGSHHYHGTYTRINNSDTLLLIYDTSHVSLLKFALITDTTVILKSTLEDTISRKPFLFQIEFNSLKTTKTSYRNPIDTSSYY